MSPTSPRQPGARAPASKVHRDSHLIHKASSSSPPSSSSTTNSSVSSSSPAHHQPQPRPPPRPKHPPPPQQQQPVIIYTHSPKVIRTSPRDFMSIVQKLTGLDSTAASPATAAQDEHSSSSSTDSCGANGSGSAAPVGPHYVADPQQLMMPPPAPPLDHAHFMPPDIPLFAPAGDQHIICASRAGLYGHFPPAVLDAAAANMHDAGAPFSPSMVEAMRTTFPDYQLNLT